MRMKTIISHLLLAMLLSVSFVSCTTDDEHSKELTLIIASEKCANYSSWEECGNYSSWSSSPYFAKSTETDRWDTFSYIEGFDHEVGYEYRVKVWQEKWHNGEIADAPMYRYKLLEVLSKVKKDSENIPDQLIYLIIASRKTPDSTLPYYVKTLHYSPQWTPCQEIEGFEYEEGYQYEIVVEKKFRGSDTLPKYTYSYIRTNRKEQMNSTELPQ